MRLKVVSDGTRSGTKVVNAETGEGLSGMVAVRWEMGHDDKEAFAIIKTRADVVIEGVTVQAPAETQHPAFLAQLVERIGRPVQRRRGA